MYFKNKLTEMEAGENINKLDYNTSREKLAMPEYGRNILRMVEHLKTIEDRDKRSEQARAVVKSMEILNPRSISRRITARNCGTTSI